MTEPLTDALGLLQRAHNADPQVWVSVYWSSLRSWRGRVMECPLTHAARVLAGQSFACRDWPHAAAALGIPAEVASRIDRAAEDEDDPLRPQLVAVYQ